MRAVRRAAVETAIPARRWGLVLGTLGRQGNPKILDHLRSVLDRKGLQYTVVLLSEVRWPPGCMVGYSFFGHNTSAARLARFLPVIQAF